MPVFEEVPEEEWEKEDHESSQETMNVLNRKLEEMPAKVKESMLKAGITEAQMKEHTHVAFAVSYFNYRKEYSDFQIAEKKGKCPQCPKEHLLKASMSFLVASSVSNSIEKLILVPTRQHVKSSMDFLDKGYRLISLDANSEWLWCRILREDATRSDSQERARGRQEVTAQGVYLADAPLSSRCDCQDKFDRIANYCEIYYSAELKHPNIVQFKCAWLIPAGTRMPFLIADV